MNAAIIVMTILGCGQGDAACEYVRTVDTLFLTRAECEAKADDELLKTGSAGYPEVVAVCAPPRNEVAAIPDLPGPSTDQEIAAVAPPQVIRMPEELKPKNPVEWTVDKTRKLVGGVKKFAAATWRGLTGGLKPKRQGDPVLLSQFTSTDI